MPDEEDPLGEDREEEEEEEEEDDLADLNESNAPHPDNPKDPKKNKKKSTLEYTLEFEQLLKENGDHAQVYSILHQMAHLKYKRLFDRVNIPLIMITAAIGFLTGIGIDYPHIGIILGGGSMLVSVTKSIMAYMKWSEQSENHRICSLQFGQIATEIKTELSLRKEQRQLPKIMLDVIKVKLKNLMEVAHIIDNDVIRGFQQKYMDSDSKLKEYTDAGVTFPPIFSDLPGIKILGASTEAERTRQQKKSVDELREQLKADRERTEIEHEHERLEITEQVYHTNEIRRIHGGTMKGPTTAPPMQPIPSNDVLPMMRQGPRAAMPYSKKAMPSPIPPALLASIQKNPLHRSTSLDATGVGISATSVPLATLPETE